MTSKQENSTIRDGEMALLGCMPVVHNLSLRGITLFQYEMAGGLLAVLSSRILPRKPLAMQVMQTILLVLQTKFPRKAANGGL
jgi:hypothetical protein